MYLEHDAFRISYDRSLVRAERIVEEIARLGYHPKALEGAVLKERPAAPAPRTSLNRFSIDRRKPTFIEFFAPWCSACRLLETAVLKSEPVEKALEPYNVIRIDTDSDPSIARDFDVFAIPTLVALDTSGAERFRMVGVVEPESLIVLLKP